MAIYDEDMMADLATMDEEFVEAEPAERRGGGNAVPDGNYQAFIDKVFFDRAKNDPTKILLKWELIVAAGPHKDALLYRNNMTSTPDNQRWLKADLLAAGLDTSGMRMSEVPEHLNTLLDAIVEISVKRSGTGDQERVNIYINRRVDRGDEEHVKPKTAASGTASRRSTTAPVGAGSGAARQGGSSRGLSRF
ncbi:MAG TPA: DUF669 domain-containing protein [Armatimonadota bacterium]|jgi:hypothetical protein